MQDVTKKSLKALRKRLDQNLAMQIANEYLVALAPMLGTALKIIDAKPKLPLSEQGRALKAFMFQGIKRK